MRLYNFKKIYELESLLIDQYDYKAILLMENAANSLTENIIGLIELQNVSYEPFWLNNQLHSRFAKALKRFNIEKEITFLVGAGNNGADAIATARKISIRKKDFKINILAFNEGKTELRIYQEKLIKDLNFENVDFINIDDDRILNILNSTNIDENSKYLKILKSPILVDGLTGIGLKIPLDEKLKRRIDFIEKYKAEDSFIISIDLPTGTADLSDKVLKSDLTFMLQWPKAEFFTFENRKNCLSYKVLACDMFEKDLKEDKKNDIEENEVIELIKYNEIKNLIKKRDFYSNKGNFGKVFVISNSKSTLGAPIIASKAAIKVGAGYVYLVIKEEFEIYLKSELPYIITLNYEKFEKILDILDVKDFSSTFLIGSGFGLDDETFKFFLSKLIDKKINIVIDGDGLSLISNDFIYFSKLFQKRNAKIILTPHKKEFERIYQSFEKNFSNEESIRNDEKIELDKNLSLLEKLKKLFYSNLFDGILLKDYITYFVCKTGIFCNDGCFSGFSKAGTGDFIAGVFSSLISNYDLPTSAKILLALQDRLAYDFSCQKIAYESIITQDLIQQLPYSLNELIEN